MYNSNTPSRLQPVLAEWADWNIPAFVERTGPNIGAGVAGRVTTVIGPRRVGKTWLCYQKIIALEQAGVPRSNIVYINFEDERLLPAGAELLTQLLPTHEELFAPVSKHPIWCFVDEIQNVPLWSKWVRRVLEQRRDVRLVVTGSSAKLLSTEIATELRGRADVVEVFPYSFTEYLLAVNVKVPEWTPHLALSRKAPALLRHCRNFMEWGGFPEVVGHPSPRDLLQQYYRAMFARDLIERHRISSIPLFQDYLKIQINHFSALAEFSNIEEELAAMGHELSKSTLRQYMEHAKNAFLLFDVPILRNKVTEQLRNPRKVYAIDCGLVRSIRFSQSSDLGRYLENLVYLELRRHDHEIHYASKIKECDFILSDNGKPKLAVQACYQMTDAKTREREIAGLCEAMRAHKITTGLIVTWQESEIIKVPEGRIQVRPVWEWMLDSQQWVK